MIRKLLANRYFRKVILVFASLLSEINRVVPKKSANILFYDSMNNTLSDNSLALLIYFQKNNFSEKYKFWCCVPGCNKEYIHGIKNVGIIHGIYLYLTSDYVFYSFGGFRIIPSTGQRVVNLWHGTPLKNIGKLNINDNNLKSENNNDFTYIIASSESVKDVYRQAFYCSDEQIIVCGQPRNDFLFSEDNDDILKRLGIIKEKYAKIILWMPTFRISKDGRFNDLDEADIGKTGLPLLATNEMLAEFDNFLVKKNILLVLKTHSYADYPQFRCNNIIFITNEILEDKNVYLYEFIKEFDALLTDYSSVYFDYLLLNRPIGFIVNDFRQYQERRGFIVKNPLEIMPGPHIVTMEDLEDYFLSVAEGTDDYKQQRMDVNEKFNKYKDNKTCERVTTFLFGKVKQQ